MSAGNIHASGEAPCARAPAVIGRKRATCTVLRVRNPKSGCAEIDAETSRRVPDQVCTGALTSEMNDDEPLRTAAVCPPCHKRGLSECGALCGAVRSLARQFRFRYGFEIAEIRRPQPTTVMRTWIEDRGYMRCPRVTAVSASAPHMECPQLRRSRLGPLPLAAEHPSSSEAHASSTSCDCTGQWPRKRQGSVPLSTAYLHSGAPQRLTPQSSGSAGSQTA